MAKPGPAPERKTPAAPPPQMPPSAQETKRPSDSVPMVSGSFAKLPARFGRYQVDVAEFTDQHNPLLSGAICLQVAKSCTLRLRGFEIKELPTEN